MEILVVSIFMSVIAFWLGYHKAKTENEAEMKKHSPPTEEETKKLPSNVLYDDGIHIKPDYWGYDGNYSRINKCTTKTCRTVALREDMMELTCCPNCGGSVKPYASGKWNADIGKWVLSTISSHKIKEFAKRHY